jgi:hypothetical protein
MRLPLIALDRVSDAGSIPAASTHSAWVLGNSNSRRVLTSPYGTSPCCCSTTRTALRAGGIGGGEPVSTGCVERAGGNGQATTQGKARLFREIFDSANHKRQLSRERAADGRLTAAGSGGRPRPGNRSGQEFQRDTTANSSSRAVRHKPQVRCAPLRVDVARGFHRLADGPGRPGGTETMHKIHNLRRAITHRNKWLRNEDGSTDRWKGAGWPVVRSWTLGSPPRSARGWRWNTPDLSIGPTEPSQVEQPPDARSTESGVS